VPRAKAETCGFRGCEEVAMLLLEVDGRRLSVCRQHYRLLLKRLQERALRDGAAQLTAADLVGDGS